MNTLLLLASCVALAGCATAATTRPATAPSRDDRFTISVDDTNVKWTARVNSGGWKLTTDRVAVDNGTMRVFATLERPGAGDMVTAAFSTLTGEHAADGATRAELSVRQTRRGEESGDADYKVVARSDG